MRHAIPCALLLLLAAACDLNLGTSTVDVTQTVRDGGCGCDRAAGTSGSSGLVRAPGLSISATVEDNRSRFDVVVTGGVEPYALVVDGSVVTTDTEGRDLSPYASGTPCNLDGGTYEVWVVDASGRSSNVVTVTLDT